MAFIFPIAFLYISQLMRQFQAIYSEIELQEAAANVKSFLDISQNVSHLSGRNIYVGVDINGRFLVTTYPNEANLLPGMSFIAQKCDMVNTATIAPERSHRKMVCSPSNGIWMLCLAKDEE
jgi:hypothetical protein